LSSFGLLFTSAPVCRALSKHDKLRKATQLSLPSLATIQGKLEDELEEFEKEFETATPSLEETP
jgi:hypothetical protein